MARVYEELKVGEIQNKLLCGLNTQSNRLGVYFFPPIVQLISGAFLS